MAAPYIVEALAFERIDQAYPLVQAIQPDLHLADWRRLCSRLADKEPATGQAVLIVTAATRRFYALCTAEVVREAGESRVLSLTRLIIGHAIDPQAVGEVLLQALAEQVRRAGCRALRIATAGSDQPALRAIDDARKALEIGLSIELV